MMTDAWRSPRFSSCRAFTRSLYVSSSTLSTRLCCCRDSMRFCSCSRVTGDGGIMIGPPSIELESLSDALSRSAMFTSATATVTGRIGNAGYRRPLLIAHLRATGRLGRARVCLPPAWLPRESRRSNSRRKRLGMKGTRRREGKNCWRGLIARRTCAPATLE